MATEGRQWYTQSSDKLFIELCNFSGPSSKRERVVNLVYEGVSNGGQRGKIKDRVKILMLKGIIPLIWFIATTSVLPAF